MADKTISQLTEATAVNSGDLFVLQQDNTAKSLSGKTLKNWLLEMADGRGGISDIAKTGSSGTNPIVDTYTITFANDTTTTFTVTNGIKGDKGDSWYVHFKWASQEPTADSQLSDKPDNWIGIYSGTASTAPTSYSSYTWYEYKGEKGDTGDGITSVEKTSGTGAGGTEDTYTMYAGASKKAVGTFKVRNGMDGSGSVSTVNGNSPDSTGNVKVTGADIAVNASDATTVDASLTAIKAGGLDDKAIARAKLANEVNYGTVVLATSNTAVQSSWHEAFVYVTNSDEEALNISLDGTTQSSLDAGWRCRLYAAKEFTFSWSEITSNLIDSESGIYGTSGTITVPANKYLDLRKTLDGIWMAFGNYSTAQRVILSNKIIYPANWESDTTYADYPYRGTINAANVVYPEMIPEVIFSLADSTSGKFAPIADTDYGVVHIYATEMPTENMTIPTIILWR